MLILKFDSKTSLLTMKCDSEGMGALLGVLGRLIADRASHAHIRSKSAGGKGEFYLGTDEVNDGANVLELIIDYAEGD